MPEKVKDVLQYVERIRLVRNNFPLLFMNALLNKIHLQTWMVTYMTLKENTRNEATELQEDRSLFVPVLIRC